MRNFLLSLKIIAHYSLIIGLAIITQVDLRPSGQSSEKNAVVESQNSSIKDTANMNEETSQS
jgi:hypothetical protein